MKQRLGHERNEGRRELRQVDQDLVQRAERRTLVVGILRSPEPSPASADVPIRKPIDETEKASHGHVALVIVELLAHRAHRGVELGEHPAVHVGPIRERGSRNCGRPAVDVRIGHEEAVDVPNLEQKFPDRVCRCVVEKASALPGHGPRIERPSHRIGADPIHEYERVGVVLVALAELLSLLVGHQAEDDAVLEWVGKGALRKHE